MLFVQLALIPIGLFCGLMCARRLRGLSMTPAERTRMLVAFAAGGGAFVLWAAFTMPAPYSWVFLATMAAVYAPCLAVLASPARPATNPE